MARHYKTFMLCPVYGLFATSALTMPNVAMGQVSEVQVSTPDAAVGLEDIVVTARKRAENLQDTPIAVTALSADDLIARSATRLDEAASFAPNIEISGGASDAGGAGFASVYIRGIGQRDYSNATDPGVGVYVDNVYLGRSVGAILDLPDVEQVEVLRGPQGTLFGKNTMGGAINITSRQPTGKTGFQGNVTYGEDNRFNIDGYGEIVLGAGTSLGVAAAYKSQDGFVRRPNAGDRIGAEEAFVTRTKLSTELSDNVTLLISGDYSNIGGTTQRIASQINPNLSAAASLYNLLVAPVTGEPVSSSFTAPDINTNFGTGPMKNDFEGWGVSARLEIDFGGATLRSITAYRGFKSLLNSEQDSQPSEISRVIYDDEQTQFSQEINIFGTAFDNRLDWLAGAYYLRENADAYQKIDIFQGLFQAVSALPGPVIPGAAGIDCALMPHFCIGGPGNPLNALVDIRIDNSFGTKTESYAAFAEATWQVSDQWSLVLGGRFTRDNKDFYSALLRPVSGVPAVPLTIVSKGWSAFTPRAVIQFKPNSDLQLYASYSKGFKSGGFNSRASSADAVRTPYDPEGVTSFEVGAKTELLDRRLRINTAAFFYKYKDIQLNASGVGGDGFTPIEVIANVGAAEIKGFEIEAVAIPFELLTINASLGYTDAKYTRLGSNTLDATLASALPRTPKWSANLGAQLNFPMANASQLMMRIDYDYRSKYYNDPANTGVISSAAASIVNARVAYRADEDRYSIAVYAKNLFNERFLVNGFNSLAAGGIAFATPNEPREIGVTIGVKF